MKRISTIFAAALCLAALAPVKAADPVTPDNLTMVDFNHSIKLMVDGYTGIETLENFPVLVRVSEAGMSGFHYADMSAKNSSGKTTGRDLAFFTEDGVRLPAEVDTWSHNSTSLVWVALSEMTQGTKFYMCYNVDDGVYVTNANPWAEYVGVWHLKEEGGTSKSVIKNSTTNILLGTTSSKGKPAVVNAGKIGAARRIATDTGNNPGYDSGITVALTNSADLAAVNGLAPRFTASFWYCPEADTANYEYLLSRKSSDGDTGWGLQFGGEKSGRSWDQIRIYGSQQTGNQNFAIGANATYTSLGGDNFGIYIPAGANGKWQKMDCVWSDTTYRLYVDGEFVAAGALRENKPATTNTLNLSIGGGLAPASGKGCRGFKGVMDEARVRVGTRSDDWVKADFDTVDNRGFVIGPQVATWAEWNGSAADVIDTTTVEPGDHPVHADRTKATDANHSYRFVGWNTDPEATTALDLSTVLLSAPTTFYAIWAEHPVAGWATVNWFGDDGTTALDPATTYVDDGARPVHANPPPKKPTLHDRYTFAGWTPAGGNGSPVYATEDLPAVSGGDTLAYKAVFDVEHSADPDPSFLGFTYSATLNVVGYTGSAAVEDFPVLVRVSETAIDGFLYAGMHSPGDGADLAFFDLDGNALSFEIDTWVEGGESLVWVRLPSMHNGTKFSMHWGSALVTGADVCPGNAWSGYAGVWHMNDSGDGGATVSDSTTNALDGTAVATSVRKDDGRIGGARFITSNQGNAAGSPYDSGVMVNLSSDAAKRAVVDAIVPEFSASMWIRPQNATLNGQSQFEYLISRRAADKGPGWGAQFDKKSSEYSPLRVYSNEETDNATDGRGNPADVKVSTGASTGIVYREWHKVDLAWTADGKYKIFVDGVQTSKDSTSILAGGPVTNCLAATLPLALGGSAAPLSSGDTSGRGFYGDMDEVRLRPGALSADRALADFETVTNRNFLALAALEIAWSSASGTNGFASIGCTAATVGGTVEFVEDGTTCAIEGKIWADGGDAPAEWTTLTNGLVLADAFAVRFAGLADSTTYRYSLRAVGSDGSSTVPVAGAFTTAAGLSVTWDGASGTNGLAAIGSTYATVAGTVASVGDDGACAIQCKIWADGGTEPASWTTLTNGLAGHDAFSGTVGGLRKATTYRYSLRALGDAGTEASAVSGTFETGPGLTVAWSGASGTAGFSKIASSYALVAGTVSCDGDAGTCAVQARIWPDGGDEPAWTELGDGFAEGAAFSLSVEGLASGTAYRYKLRAVAAGRDESETLSGVFATPGSSGDDGPSPYVHLFTDGEDTYYVARDFERYLRFTVTGYTGSEVLTNFPVMVEVRKGDTNGFSYDDFYHYDGRDMVFVDETGHILPHEIDTWNKNGMSMIWVRIPELVNGTTFTMCYRSPLVDPPPDAGNVFEKYVGVWHMGEPRDGVVLLADSTANDLPGETHAQSKETEISFGRIGRARRVAQKTGSSSSYGRIIVFDHDDILRTGVGNVFTFSGWYKIAGLPPKWPYLVSRKAMDQDVGWGIQFQENDTATLRVWSGSKEKNKYQSFATPGYTATDWNYWTFVFDGSVNPDGTTNRLFHAYMNGEELGSTSTNFVLNYPVVNDENASYDNLVIGGVENGTGAFNGWVDEARYSKGIRSADWIKAEYDSNNQKVYWNDERRRFVTKGDRVGRGEESLVPVVIWEQGDGLPVTIIDVSYAYVQFAGTVTFCGAGADDCWIEYKLWPDGEAEPDEWTTLLADATAGTRFSIPVTGLKQDMPYLFRIRAVNEVGDVQRQNREHSGSFRTNGNVELADVDGELLRVDDKFVHLFRKGHFTFTTPDYVTNVEILVVGGGGAGGYKVGGGGGGGGLFHSESFPVTSGTVYGIQVGEGGNAAKNLSAHSEQGQYSYFALATDEEHPLILVPGGGGGGSYVNDAELAAGEDGASGGGGTYAQAGGTATDGGVFGHAGGQGNDNASGGSVGKVAAGGGGGAGRAGLSGTLDAWSAGGAGGVGVECDITGERLFYGAGGGGGYVYRKNTDGTNFTKPGTGGSGIGGDAADVRNGTPATSGVENTGAGGGGGSAVGGGKDNAIPTADDTYWRGGDGGDGVVLIAYQVHGRDPIAEEPRITMTRCVYDPDGGSSGTGLAEIDYRAFWAGIQAQTNDIYVLYSTVGEDDIANGGGERIKVAGGAIGIGSTTFVPPETGHTYWIRLVARKDANSFMYSDEIASFYVPAVALNGAIWGTAGATVTYKLYDRSPETRLFCYWSESRDLLEGDGVPTGDGVRFKDLGTGMSGGKTFQIPFSEGLDKTKVYYVRIAAGDEGGWRLCLSEEIAELSDKPGVILESATWSEPGQAATVGYTLNLTVLDPADTELFALYSTNRNDVTKGTIKNLKSASLGNCADLPNGVLATNLFPLYSAVDATYYVRLALHSACSNAWICFSTATKDINVKHATANTLYVYAAANAKKSAYGDAPKELDFAVSYGGVAEGPGWENKPGVVGAPTSTVTSATVPGLYDITQGTIELSNGGAAYHQDKVVDPETGETVSEEINCYYVLSYLGAQYTVTNAQFSVTIPDIVTNYTGEAIDTGAIEPRVSGVRNDQPVTYKYRVGDGEWLDTIGTTYSETWTHTVQFKATAPNHDEANGTFMVAINPAPLTATITAEGWSYTGMARQPEIETGVTGHMKPDLNPLVCEFRDDAGEWQADVPSFTQPGTYTLWFRASASNHVTAVTNCEFTIQGWDFMVNMDRQTGYPTPIRVTDPGWFIRNSTNTAEELSVPGKRYAALDERCPNGLKLWQNYVLEREIDDDLVAAIHQACSRVAENHFEIRFPNVDVLGNTGLAVNYRLDSKLKRRNDATFVPDEHSDKFEMNVPLGPEDPTGLYVFNIVLSTTNDPPALAVLPSVATVGVLRVTSPATNTVLAVPWMSMASANPTNEPVVVSETVNPNGLSDGTREGGGGDRILVYDAATGKFRSWSHLTGTSWSSATTVTKSGLSSSDADTTTLAPGSAFWLVRNDPGDATSTNYVYLVGRYAGDEYEVEINGGTTEEPGYTLVANPTMDDVYLNATNDLPVLRFVDGSGDAATPADGDRIVVQDAAGFQKVFLRKGGEWGRWVSRKVGRRVKQTWEKGDAIPSGTGFWYVRTADGDLSIRFGSAE